VPAGWDAFEVAVRAVLGQQITVKGAITLASRLAARLGTPANGNLGVPGLTHAFPRPQRFTVEALAGSGMPGTRARALAAVAEAAARDARLLEPRGELEETIEALCELRGVGEWTAHYIAMRAMGETDAFLASDIGVLRGLAVGGKRPTPAEALARAERWRPWRAYAVLHLWMGGAAAPPDANAKSRTKERVHAIHD
jgi:AraC family transcriptional regulator of adaptative response / DNA-3-methyladenine glycosylase II